MILEDKMKKPVLIKITLLSFVFGIMLYSAFILKVHSVVKEVHDGNRLVSDSFNVNTTAGKRYFKTRQEIEEQAKYEYLAEDYAKNGEYDKAIELLNKALAMSKYSFQDWMSHKKMLNIYEKAGRYPEALKEIDWLIAQKPRQDVVDELQQRKQKILKAIADKK
jgi:tetratricopeptide (TPR) repeat protein